MDLRDKSSSLNFLRTISKTSGLEDPRGQKPTRGGMAPRPITALGGERYQSVVPHVWIEV